MSAHAPGTIEHSLRHIQDPPQTEQRTLLRCDNDDHDGNGSLSSWRDIFRKPARGPPTLGLDFMRAVQNSTTTRYGVGARREGPQKDGDEEQSQSALILGQDLGKLGLGAVVWDCGDDLAAFLGRHRHLVVGKRVLDLGTGTGIAGLAAAQCGAREVILTDHAAMEALVRSNVERNAGRWASRVSFTAFAWDSTTAQARKLASPDTPFDLVLASDCLYDPTSFPAFRQALVNTCSPRSVLIMAYKRRLDRREQDFFAQLEEDLDLELVDPRHHQLLVASSETSATTTTARGVYLLLGARGGYRHKKRTSSPLDEWRIVRKSEPDQDKKC